MEAKRCFLVLALAVSYANAKEWPVVEIPDGVIRGAVSSSYAGRTFSQFVGVPYGKAPVGHLRFEDPVKVDGWKGIWVANKTTSCVQFMMDRQIGEEDCLHLNVYVPGEKIKPEANLDVIVHIHGGAFMIASGDTFGPKYLMDNDVVLVTLNYRLGVFGFLSTGDERLPGNLGMKDQVLALKWIKNNIRHFGGNPESVTITGLSAGSASVHYHLLSPSSKGLFAKAISMSGSALNAWTFQEKPLDKARAVGEAVGCAQTSTEDLVNCLKTRSSERLSKAPKVLQIFKGNPFSPVALVVDSASENPFLPQHPYELLMKGQVHDVPLLLSAVADEGLCPAATLFTCDSCFEKMNDDWNEVAPAILHYSEAVPEDRIDEVSQRIRQFYYGDEDISRDNFERLVQMSGDRLFLADLELTARLHSNAIESPLYFYYFNYTADMRSFSALFSDYPERLGVSHGDDYMMITSDVSVETLPRLSGDDERMMEAMVAIWTNFARSGEPNVPIWKPVSKQLDDPFDYLHIQHGFEMKQAEELGFRSFWESLPFEENANLFKTKDLQ